MISDGVLEELAIIAKELVRRNPDATFGDLLKVYFRHITGVDYSDDLDSPPDDEEIILYHLKACNVDSIAKILHDDSDYIRWRLLTYGFSPNIRTKEQLLVEWAKYDGMVKDGTLG